MSAAFEANSAASITVAIPDGALAGDVAIAHVLHNNGSDASQTTPSGWTSIARVDSGTSVGHRIYWRVLPASGGSVMFTGSGGDLMGAITVYRGAGTPSVVASNFGNSTVLTAPGVTAVPAGSVILRAYTHDGGADFTNTTPPLTRYLVAGSRTLTGLETTHAMLEDVPQHTINASIINQWVTSTVLIPPAN